MSPPSAGFLTARTGRHAAASGKKTWGAGRRPVPARPQPPRAARFCPRGFWFRDVG